MLVGVSLLPLVGLFSFPFFLEMLAEERQEGEVDVVVKSEKIFTALLLR